jgi:hypothetical protein
MAQLFEVAEPCDLQEETRGGELTDWVRTCTSCQLDGTRLSEKEVSPVGWEPVLA